MANNVEAFENALKDVVNAKRLSQTKMDALTGAALKCMQDDTQLVSILYRTHKGLSSSAKVWSLYAFDALARAARHQVNKNHIVAGVNAEQGNCATFLVKIQGVLDGLFRDLISSGNPELKEKAKKILDIWTKQNTFSSAVLSPLFAILQEAGNEKEPDKGDQSAMPPPIALSAPAVPPVSVVPPYVAPGGFADMQSTLLALLSQTANAASPPAPTSQSAPSPPNNATSVPPAPVLALDANQLALLQQLAQAAQGNAASSQPVPVPASVVPSMTTPNAVPVVPGGPPQPQPLPYRDDQYGPPNALAPRSESEQQKQQHAGGHGPPDRGYPRDDYYNQTQNFPNHAHANEYPTHDPRRGGAPGQRGGYRDRGGPGRGRGRGRWDRDERGGPSEHNPYRDRSRDFDAGGGPYDLRGPGRRSSRSRSPPGRFRNGGMGQNRRGARPYSPPRGPSYQDGPREPRYAYGPGPDANMAAGLDEFGREIRPRSPSVAGSDVGGQSGRRPSDSPIPPRSASLSASDRDSTAPEYTSPPLRGPSYPQSHPDQRSQAYGIPSEPSSSTSIHPTASISPSTSSHPLGASASAQGDVGLDAFDRASFDPSQADSWAALGKAWMVTHGSMPSQEELMQFVMGGVPLPPSVSTSSTGPSQNGYEGGGPGSSPTRGRDSYEDQTQGWMGHDDDRQWTPNRGFGQRGGWRGRGGDGGSRGGPGRGRGGGYGEGRGDFGGGGRGRGDYGRGGYDQGPRSNAHGDYGHGSGRGSGRGDFHGRDEYGHGYGRGDYGSGPGPGPQYSNGDARGAYSAGRGNGRGYGPGYNNYQDTDAVMLTDSGNSGDALWSDQSQQHHQQSSWLAPQNADNDPSAGESGGSSSGGASSAGKMQKVGDRWVFVRGAA